MGTISASSTLAQRIPLVLAAAYITHSKCRIVSMQCANNKSAEPIPQAQNLSIERLTDARWFIFVYQRRLQNLFSNASQLIFPPKDTLDNQKAVLHNDVIRHPQRIEKILGHRVHPEIHSGCIC